MELIWLLAAVGGLIVAGLVFWSVLVLRKLGTPTRGVKIDVKTRRRSALVIIDIQEDFTRNTGKNAFDPEERKQVLARTNRLISKARQDGEDVIFVQNVFRDLPVILAMKIASGGIGTPGRDGLRLDRELDVGSEPVFEKSIGDTFSNKDFDAYLAEKGIGSLKLVGLDACHCVQLTAKGALQRGYEVEVIEPALLTAFPEKWPSFSTELIGLGARVSDETAVS
ncbi:cysteine hydrolase family protein [Roseibium polysiphoniae]|uniref:Cysteine hydrolase n=1 Tax=Roseibium polysiphoniae TaxID=2571221 RepID=A0ABR9CEF4_9HYPH|nr:cysteine hydrolase [Roseibium polysiphoniae]MBD8877993.1 cysteine hydrolase [Roseibium polysiphoniae]